MICSILIVLLVTGSVAVSQVIDPIPCTDAQNATERIEGNLDIVDGYLTEETPDYGRAVQIMREELNETENHHVRDDLEAQKRKAELTPIEGSQDLYLENLEAINLAPVPDDCEETEHFVYAFRVGNESFWVPAPRTQNVYYVECQTKKCREGVFSWNLGIHFCVKANYVPHTFWAYGPVSGFKLFRKRFPRCCVCKPLYCI